MAATAAARRVNVDEIVGPVAPASKGSAWLSAAASDAAASAFRGTTGYCLARVSDARVVDHRFLHRDLDALASASSLALVQRRQNANRRVQTCAGVTDVRSRLQGRPVYLAGQTERTIGRLGDHVK